jgi:subtilisin family serine protease
MEALMKLTLKTLFSILMVVLVGCQPGLNTPSPTVPALPTSQPNVERPKFAQHFDAESGSAFQIDLRGQNLTDEDMRAAGADLLYADFDTRTTWPPAEWMPENFSPQVILELGKDPGLGVRGLHQQGITGKGISIAIIDQPLLKVHIEYGDRLKLYETIGPNVGSGVSMHGPAVASIAVGRTVGTAPDANLYYISAYIPFSEKDGRMIRDFQYYAEAVRRVVEINKGLPAGEKIRVLSISVGWDPVEPGYDDMVSAVDEALNAGIFVVSSSLDETYDGFKFNGAGRDPMSDPNNMATYQAGTFWAKRINDSKLIDFWKDRILVPMDSRTYASYKGNEDYAWGRTGGWSWCIPYIAGLYAMSAQVNPDITPDVFWQAVETTAIPFFETVDGQETPIGKLIQPVAVIEAVKRQAVANHQ